MKRFTAFLLALTLIFSLAACGSKSTGTPEQKGPPSTEENASEPSGETAPATRTFTDSLGREVELPAEIEHVALSGPLAQIALFALCPDKLVGVSKAWTSAAEEFLDPEYFNMPEIGQLYGGKGELNLETLLASGAQVVIDVGEPKKNTAEDLDALQAQTGIPFVHVSGYIDSLGEMYRMLGELVGMEEEAETLAVYCEEIYQCTMKIVGSVEKANVLYIAGNEGLNVIAEGSYHAEVINLMVNNLADLENPTSVGDGDPVDLEQILNWNPDHIFFAPASIYATVGDDPSWQTITAIQNGTYYEVPAVPYNWMGFPPAVQRLLGMMWMTKILYPEMADYDLYEEVARYFDLFYHCDLSREQYDRLVANSVSP